MIAPGSSATPSLVNGLPSLPRCWHQVRDLAAQQVERCILEGLPHFNRGAVSIPNIDKLVRELRALERRAQRSGEDAVDHPAHGSDDFANALCGALYISLSDTHKPVSWVGAIGMDGQVQYLAKNNPHMRPERPGLRFIHVDECGNELTP